MLTALVAALAGSVACDGEDCPSQACVSGFELTMLAARGGPESDNDGRFANGLWTIVVEADGGLFEGTCDVSGLDGECMGSWTTPSQGDNDAQLSYVRPDAPGADDKAAFVFRTSEDVPPLPEATTVVTFGGEVVLEDEWRMADTAPEGGSCGSCVPRVLRSVTVDP
ncbi:MAG: hypothetical protein AAF721_17440 [Myxococcota bacterium]